LSFGSQRIVDEEGCTQEQAIEILNTALDRGIRYFDTAWIHSKGQSEERVGMVAKHRRDEMWIATKTWDATRDGARRQLEESLTRLQTDHVNEWRLHNVWGFDRLDQMTGPERLAFFREVLPMVKPENMPWKASEWGNPAEWKPRQEPNGPGLWV
jgi:aryl-alcohol dehydrogenase-like predicted oxidoreductase